MSTRRSLAWLAAAATALAGAALAACGSPSAETGLQIDHTRHPILAVKPPEAELRSQLTPLQYKVTQLAHTEVPFHNEYWDNHAAGIYVDVTTGQPLFSSTDKFESGTGWPSFTRPIAAAAVVERRDDSLGMERVEVRSKVGDAHLGHLFDDGPQPTGMRYCINSASLRFVPAGELDALGYPDYKSLFPGVAQLAAAAAAAAAPANR